MLRKTVVALLAVASVGGIRPARTAGYQGLQSSGVQGGWSNPSDLSVSIASARVRPRWRQNHSPV
jgi:hypothetical protein